MQNSNSNTTMTAANADVRETERPTLAELLAERAEQRQQREMVRAQSDQQQREEERSKALDYVATWALSHISDDLRAALRMNYAVDDARLDEDLEDAYAFTCAGFATLDVSSCGADDTPAARTDPNRDERWRISREILRYEHQWTISGPYGYRVALDDGYQHSRNLDAELLDAIAAYPAWVAAADDRADAEQVKIAEEERAERERRQDNFWTADSLMTSLRRMCVKVAGARAALTYYGTIHDVTDAWLLLDVEKTSTGPVHQRVIPIARVISITPNPKKPTA